MNNRNYVASHNKNDPTISLFRIVVVVFGQSIEAWCQAKDEDVVGAAPTGDYIRGQPVYCVVRCGLFYRLDGMRMQHDLASCRLNVCQPEQRQR